jgi:two-component system, NtrC family, sensor kinase
MKKYCFIVTFVCVSLLAHAQVVILSDSVRLSLEKGADDSNKVKRYIDAITYLPYNYPDTGLYYADRIIRLAEKIGYEYGKAAGYYLKGASYAYSGDYANAVLYYTRSLAMHKAMGDQHETIGIWQGIAYVYSELGDHKKALEYLLRARRIFISSGDSIYSRVDKQFYPTAGNLAFNAYLIGEAYLKMGLTDSALKYSEHSYSFYKNRWPSTPRLRGDIYFRLGDYQSALAYYNINTEIKVPIENVHNLIGKANVYSRIGQQDSSRLFAQQALDTSNKINYAKGIMQASELLAQVYEETDPGKSLVFLKLGVSVKDSLYSKTRVNQVNSIAFNDELRRLDAIAAEKAARNRFKIWSLAGTIFILLVTGFLLWRNNQHRKKSNFLLQQEKQTVEKTLEELKATQAQLIQAEKMASLGELTAGIAHEIQNPLNFVNNFSEVNTELLNELEAEAAQGNMEEVRSIAADLKENEQKIAFHGRRADSIVKGMLQHSRQSTGKKEPTNINQLADEYLRLSYQGMRAKDKNFNATLETSFDKNIGNVSVVAQDIGRVLLNLFNNAFYAVQEKKWNVNGQYEPVVSVSTKKGAATVEIVVRDNGAGISQKAVDKIFQPFFTTKPTGEGTGLGLSLSYDIITKGHGGEIKVETTEGEGTSFVVLLPGYPTS